VSVILPVYDRAAAIGGAIESALAQTYAPIEVLVVDNGSTDGTEERVRAFGARVKLLHEPRRGPYPARNRGVASAQGELVAFLDSDDRWLPGKLEAQVRALEARPEVALVFTGYVVVDGRANPPRRRPPPYEVRPRSGRVFAALARSNFIANSAVLVRRAALDEAGPFCEARTLGADYRKWLEIASRHEVFFVDETLMELGLQGDNVSASRIQALHADMAHQEELIATLADPAHVRIIRRERLARELRLALVHGKRGLESLARGLTGRGLPASGLGFAGRLALFLRILVERLT
jgi:glycosyltransferase involved in cell wall biosynthesis